MEPMEPETPDILENKEEEVFLDSKKGSKPKVEKVQKAPTKTVVNPRKMIKRQLDSDDESNDDESNERSVDSDDNE